MAVPATLDTVAVIGNGLIGHGMARIFAAAGREAVMIGRRGESLTIAASRATVPAVADVPTAIVVGVRPRPGGAPDLRGAGEGYGREREAAAQMRAGRPRSQEMRPGREAPPPGSRAGARGGVRRRCERRSRDFGAA